MKTPLFFLTICFSTLLNSQTLVKDINTNTGSSTPESSIQIGDKIFFWANDGKHGKELWVTDGTATGTKMVKDISIGEKSTLTQGYIGFEQINYNDKLLFCIYDNNTETSSLYISDGSEQGTKLIKTYDRNLSSLTQGGQYAYFEADLGLWRTDGTEGGTVQVFDYSKLSHSFLFGTAYKNQFYFWNKILDGSNRELWVSNGTSEGTKPIKFLKTNPNYYFNEKFIVFKDKLCFIISTVENGAELWTSDGTEANTKLIKDLSTTTITSDGAFLLYATQNALFFVGGDANDRKLYSSDGTAAGTKPVSTFSIGNSPYAISENDFYGFPFKNKFFGLVRIKGNYAYSLIESDGTADGTKIVKEEFIDYISDRKDFVTSDSLIFFNYYSPETQRTDLYASDGTAKNLFLVKDIYGSGESEPHNFIKFGNTILFAARNRKTGIELWQSDGTDKGTILVKDINAKSANTFENIGTDYGKLGNTIFFNTLDSSDNYNIWKSDGTNKGTMKVNDAVDSSFSSIAWGSPITFFEFNNKLYFNYTNDSLFSGLYYVDLQSKKPVIVKKPAYEGDHFTVKNMTKLNNKFIFRSSADSFGEEIWISDGTADGTKLLADLSTGYKSTTFLTNFLEYNGALYFWAITSDTTIAKLWKTDGTSEGTVVVKNAGNPLVHQYFETNNFKRMGNLMFYPILLPGLPPKVQLWVYDGQKSTQLADLNNYSSGYDALFPFVVFNNKLYFIKKNDVAIKHELWATDGTNAGTKKVSNTLFGNYSNFKFNIFKNNLYIFAYDKNEDRGLWKVDVNDNISFIKIVHPQKNTYYVASNGYSASKDAIEWNGLLYFQGNNGINGTELWVSDGTPDGTKMLVDLNKGANSSFPCGFVAMDNALFFIADDGTTGDELWKISTTGLFEKVLNNIDFSISPNPVHNGIVTIMSETRAITEVKVYNTAGQLIYSSQANSKIIEMDLSNLTPATYILEVKSKDKVGIKKIVKM